MPLYRLRTVLCALALLSGHVSANALHTAPAVPAQVSNAAWEEDMQRFAESDARQPPPKYGIVFVGSSSIRFWETLAQDFPGKPVINRGFGGSEVRDSTWYADRIVIPYAPRQVVLYAGDNDLNSGRTPGRYAMTCWHPWRASVAICPTHASVMCRSSPARRGRNCCCRSSLPTS